MTETSPFLSVDFAGGDGSPENPFLVETAVQLDGIRNYLDKSFRQIARISMYDDENLSDAGWTPIGTEEDPFTGSYDGDGYYIELNILNEFERAGMFGVTSGAELKNINLEIYHYLTVDSYAGGIVGHAIGGSITDCYCELWSDVNDYAGGIAGVSSSTITNCGTNGRIKTQVDHQVDYVGGGVGKNDGIIQNSYSTVYITNSGTATTTRTAGGIAGVNTGTIRKCVYAEQIYNNTITGTCRRITATNTGQLIDNYAWSGSKVLGSAITGGTLNNENGLDVATAEFTPAWWENLGFILDYRPWYYNTTDTSIGVPAIDIYCWFSFYPYSGTSPLDVSLEFVSDVPPDSVDYEIAYESKPDVWVTLTSGITATIYDVGTHNIRATATIKGRLYRTPARSITVNLDSPLPDYFAGGDGSADNPYLISSREHLVNINRFPVGKYFSLVNDIDLSDFPDQRIYSFSGVFYGNGYTISGLTINGTNYAGMFSQIISGVVVNLKLAGVNINCSGAGAGAIAGLVKGNSIISYCFVDGGVVNGDSEVGGLIGYLKDGEVSCCVSSCDVSGRTFVGGLIGAAALTSGGFEAYIHDCYTTGNVTSNGGDYVGGIIGCFSFSTANSLVALNPSITWEPTSGLYGNVGKVCGRDNGESLSYARASLTITPPNPVGNGSNGKGITEDEYHNKAWWMSSTKFEFYSVESQDAPWIWNNETNLPVLRMFYDPEKPTLQDWDLRGVYPAVNPGLMWGYRGMKIGDQP